MVDRTAGPQVPTGTVTLLLGDIEGSTRLWESQPREMSAAMSRFSDVVAGAVRAHNGVLPIEQGEGDSFVAAFARATDAVACALALQHEWSRGWSFRVRLALHTGEVQTRDEGTYEGTAIIRCARLRAIAHGGQTLLSQPAHDLVVDQMPDGAWLDDLGVHYLKDIERPERVHQLCHADLPVVQAALRSADAVLANLPVQLTSFIGREREIDTVLSLLQTNRIVSLLGVGGCGKTRLSVEVAARALVDFPDGLWFVELAPIDAPDLVAQSVLAAIGGREQPGRSAVETIISALAGRTALLVMDNCEHVVSASAAVASKLLSGLPTLTILATSREQLGVPGEVTFTLPSLSIDREAVDLFVDRAVKARPGFTITAENSAAIGEICRRLDGMPLALELAAARIRSLSPEQIRDGLSDRFRLLSTGARTLLPRQQTLRGSVDWSYDLLTDEERAALRRLSIFAGGFDLEAAQAVVTDVQISDLDVTDLVGSLVDKSLLLVDDRGRFVRYRLLETIREYGAERLDEASERTHVAQRHRTHYRSLLHRANAEEEGPDQAEWKARVIADMDNVRAALQSALGAGDGEALIELTCGAGNTWTLLGGSTEHHRWVVEALARAPIDSPFRASALYQLGITYQFVGDMESAYRYLGDSLPLYEAGGDEVGRLWALSEYAFVIAWRDGFAAAQPVFEEGIAAARAIGAEGARFSMEHNMGQYMVLAGRPAEARDHLEAALAGPAPVEHFRQWAMLMLALSHTTLGDLARADQPVDECIAYARGAGDRMTLGMGLWVCSILRVAQARIEDARAAATELESVVRDLGPLNWAWVMHGIAEVAIAEGNPSIAFEVCDEALQHLAQAHLEVTALHDATKAAALAEIGDPAAREQAGVVLDATSSGAAPSDRVRALVALAHVDHREGRLDDAEAHAHEALSLSRPMGHKRGVVEALELLGMCAVDAQSYGEAARLLGGADALRQATGYLYRSPRVQQDFTESQAALELVLGSAGLGQGWAEGAALSLEDACDYATRGRGERKRPPTGWAALTATEAKVAALVAEGLTNVQVGEQLFISRHTVDSHLRHIYAKLGVSTRAELATRVANAQARKDGADA